MVRPSVQMQKIFLNAFLMFVFLFFHSLAAWIQIILNVFFSMEKKGLILVNVTWEIVNPFFFVFCFVDSNVWMTHFIVKHSFLAEMFFITKKCFFLFGKVFHNFIQLHCVLFPFGYYFTNFFLFVECHTVCGWTTNKKGLNQQWCNYYRQQQKRHFFMVHFLSFRSSIS